MTLALVDNDPTTSVQSTNTTSYEFDLPGSLQEGDWLLCIMGKNGTGDIFPSDFWQPARNGGLSNGFALLNAFWRYVDSGYTGETTDTFTGNSENVATAVYHFRGGNLEAQPPRVSWDTSGATTSPDPPSHTSPYGNQEHIWICGVFHSSTGSTSAAPANYTNLAPAESGGAGGVGVATAIRTLTAATEDPGSFTWGTARTPGMFTLAIPTAEPTLQDGSSPTFIRRYSHYESSGVDPVPVPLVDIDGLGAVILLSIGDGNTTITTPSGWASLGTQLNDVGNRRLSAYYREGDGSEGSTVDFALSSSQQAAAYVYVFDDIDFSTDPPTWTTDAAASSTTVDPPDHTFASSGWYVVVMGHIHQLGGPGDVVTYPTNFENIVWQESNNANQVSIATAFDFVDAGSEDPPSYEIDPARDQAVYTLSILGVTGGQDIGVGQATETETSNPITPLIDREVSVGQTTETETANPITPLASRIIPVGTATERELARAITPGVPSLVTIGTAIERELAQVMTPSKEVPGQIGVTCTVLSPTVTCEVTV